MASFQSVSEQFVQDIVSCPDRLMRMLKVQAVGKEGWSFDADEMEGDVVNQEYTVGEGRIDVIATFLRRTKLLIVEVKAGIADSAAVDQLKWYLKPEQLATLRRDKQLIDVENDDVVGFLIAQDFSGIPRHRISANVHLFQCIISDARDEPQLVYMPPENLPEAVALATDQAGPNPSRSSQLMRLSDHVNYIGPKDWPPETSRALREVFKSFTRCCLAKGHPDLRWVYANVKGEHVWVHYKGVQLLCLWARKKWFYVQYGLSPLTVQITVDNYASETVRKCDNAISRDRDVIDAQLCGSAPDQGL